MGTIQVTWEGCKEAFEPDGSLRDVYIQSTTLDDWQKFIDFVKSSRYEATFLVGHELSSLPREASSLLGQAESSLLSVSFSGITLNCHFFSPEEIELDLDPKEVNNQERFVALMTFISSLGQVLGKEVKITLENLPERPLFVFVPENNEVKCMMVGKQGAG